MRAFRHLPCRSLYRIPPHRNASSLAYSVSEKGALSTAQVDVASVSGDGVQIRWVAAGVNEIDFSRVGNIGGSEGAGIVESVGSNVKKVKPGDFVIPVKSGLGTWTELSVLSENDVCVVPNTLRPEIAATLTTAPFTAFRLLSDFAKMEPGDVILQNAAGGPVGTAVVQLAAAIGLKTVSLVRETASTYAPTVERLKLLGGDVVVGEYYASHPGLKVVLDDLPKPKLALNGSPDAESVNAFKLLAPGSAKVVSYPPAAGGIKGKKFDIAKWLESANRTDVEQMVETLALLAEKGNLTGWLQRVPFEDLANAVRRGPQYGRKYVAMMKS